MSYPCEPIRHLECPLQMRLTELLEGLLGQREASHASCTTVIRTHSAQHLYLETISLSVSSVVSVLYSASFVEKTHCQYLQLSCYVQYCNSRTTISLSFLVFQTLSFVKITKFCGHETKSVLRLSCTTSLLSVRQYCSLSCIPDNILVDSKNLQLWKSVVFTCFVEIKQTHCQCLQHWNLSCILDIFIVKILGFETSGIHEVLWNRMN